MCSRKLQYHVKHNARMSCGRSIGQDRQKSRARSRGQSDILDQPAVISTAFIGNAVHKLRANYCVVAFCHRCEYEALNVAYGFFNRPISISYVMVMNILHNDWPGLVSPIEYYRETNGR
jgi:hypothetical protein